MLTLSGTSLTALLQDLVRFNTTNPPGNEAACIHYVDALLHGAGLETAILGQSRERPNLMTRLEGQGKAPPLLLYGHLDVVTTAGQDWQHPPFEARLVDGYLWGRGALDMKGGIVMMLASLLRAKSQGLVPPGDVVLALVSDEEAGSHHGARYLVENHADLFAGIRYAIGEFGGFSMNIGARRFYPIMVAEKQVCRLRATLRGPGGHGSLPARGGTMSRLSRMLESLERRPLPVHITPATRMMFNDISGGPPFPANLLMGQLLNRRLTGPLLSLMGEKTRPLEPLFRNVVNPTIVRGGEKINVIPSEITVEMDGRLLPGLSPETMLAEVSQVVGRDVELEVIQYDQGPSEPDMGLFPVLGSILREADPEGMPVPMLLPASTDGRLFSRLGIQTYGFLPTPLPPGFNFFETIHGANERIPVAALDFGAEAIFRLLERFGD